MTLDRTVLLVITAGLGTLGVFCLGVLVGLNLPEWI